MNSRLIPWVAVGFVIGAAAGFQWGKTAKSKIGESVKTDFNGGVLSVTVDTYAAARSGLGETVNSLIEGYL